MAIALVLALTATLCASGAWAVAAADEGAPWVELVSPQSDDQGHYVAMPKRMGRTIYGLVAAEGKVKGVVVNGKEARLFDGDLRPFGAPTAVQAAGFQAYLWLEPTTSITVVVEDATGAKQTRVFVPETEATTTRLRELLAERPQDAVAHARLANALGGQEKYDEAITEYQATIAINPDDAEAHINLGVALHVQGKLDEAIAEYQKAIAINADDAEAHNNLGAALAHQGKSDEAIAEYRKVIAINPDDAEAHYNLGNALADQGNLDEAIAEWQKAIAINPDFAEPHYNLGAALGEQGKSEDAIAEYKKAIAINDDYAEAHWNLAIVYWDLKRYAEAKKEAEATVRLGDPTHGQAPRMLQILRDNGY